VSHNPSNSARFSSRDPVDFVVIGAGAAGGVMARELSRAGFRVVVLEQGPHLHKQDFRHDEFAITNLAALTNDPRTQPNTFRAAESEPPGRGRLGAFHGKLLALPRNRLHRAKP